MIFFFFFSDSKKKRYALKVWKREREDGEVFSAWVFSIGENKRMIAGNYEEFESVRAGS